MPWLQVKIATSADHAPAIEEALTEAGAVSVTLEGADESPIFEPAPGETPLWDATRVVGLFEDEHAHEAVLGALAGLDDETAAEPEFEQVPDREWSRAWMDDWAPLRFGDHLWVAPEDASVDDPEGVVLRLDPGLAFGTGTHATTALCLEWLAGQDVRGVRVLDYGCGSGILAVAALRLGAAHAHAVDIDPQALEASVANSEKNGVVERLATADEETLIDDADVVLANVLAGPLIEASQRLAACQPPGGRIVLTGILSDQTESVIAAYRNNYAVDIAAERDGWSLITGRRRGG